MKKITHLILSIVLLIFTNGCADYKPIFGSTKLQFEISDYTILGDKILGNKIYSKLYNLSKSNKDNQNIKSIDLTINVSKNKNATSKNSAGKILEYKITLNTEVKIIDFITNDKILNQTFISSLTYKAQDQYSNTVKLENKSTEILINKIYEKLIIKLSQNIETT